MRIVDAHHHLWDLTVRDQPWTGDVPALRRSFHLAELEPLAAEAGVTATVLVQTVHAVDETPEMLAIADTSDLVAGVVGWTDVTVPTFGDRLGDLLSGPGGRYLVGIRHQVQGLPDGAWLTAPETLRGLRQLASAGLAFDLIVRQDQLPDCVAAARAVPELSFVLDHMGKPRIAAHETEPWATDIRALAESPNVSCKLSGMLTEADVANWKIADLRPYSEVVLEAFGPERVMFGSDWPVSTLGAGYAQVVDTTRELTAGLTEEEREAVFGGTATKIYGLG